MTPPPRTAVVAVTLNCNARCVMCDIWRNDVRDELRPEEFARLPASLRDINVSGGEPFLREDLPEVVAALRAACPRARLVISTHGFLSDKIARLLPAIRAAAPDVGLRVSLDGLGERHEEIRGVPGGFARCLASLDAARAAGVTDLGIGVTLMERNVDQLGPLRAFAKERGLELSVAVATSSEIYFGADKARYRPAPERLAEALGALARARYRSLRPKQWLRGWFERRMVEFVETGRRPLACDAGRGFFYLDARGDVYACNARALLLGNLRAQTWDELWEGVAAKAARDEAATCEQCWMICTAKSRMRRQAARILPRVLAEKLRAHA